MKLNDIYLPKIVFNEFLNKKMIIAHDTRHFKQALPFNDEDKLGLFLPRKKSTSKNFSLNISHVYFKNNENFSQIYDFPPKFSNENVKDKRSNLYSFLKNSGNLILSYKPKKRGKPNALLKTNKTFYSRKKNDYEIVKELFENFTTAKNLNLRKCFNKNN